MRDTVRERERDRQREKQAPCREPDVGLDPRSPGSGPAEPPGRPIFSPFSNRKVLATILCLSNCSMLGAYKPFL